VSDGSGGRALGHRTVSPLGLGCLRLSYFGQYGEDEGRAVIVAALEAGVTLLDTADVYGPVGGPHHNERLIGAALAEWNGNRDDIVVATKGGHTRVAPDSIVRDGRPDTLKAACEASLGALGVERIDLYQYHGVDAEVPLAESVGALGELRAAGKIDMIGLSNVGRRQITEAMTIAPIVSVQNELSPVVLTSLPVVEYCRQQGIAMLSYSPGGGLDPAELARRVPALATVAARHRVSPYIVALAWQLALAPNVIPLPGAVTADQARENAAVANLRLGLDDLDELRKLSNNVSSVPVGTDTARAQHEGDLG
jgi:aryl-alcohol dehydrogenase-like predicted oxidoreductase